MENQVIQEMLVTRLRQLGPSPEPEATARAVYGVVREFATEIGMDADIETAFKEPGEQVHIPSADGWTVVFEAGPYDWAIAASFAVLEIAGVSCEPYHGFDLTFYRADR